MQEKIRLDEHTMDGLQNNLQNHYRVFLSTFFTVTRSILHECRNKLFEESFRKILKISKYLHRSKRNFVFDFLDKKNSNKFKN